jgi:hypothetical protein
LLRRIRRIKARSTLSFNAFFAGSRTIAHTPVLLIRKLLSRFRNCENMISIAAVEKLTYRQSRLCRLLGNPVAFAVVGLLANGKT